MSITIGCHYASSPRVVFFAMLLFKDLTRHIARVQENVRRQCMAIWYVECAGGDVYVVDVDEQCHEF